MENAFGRVVAVIVLSVAVFIAPMYINLAKVDYLKNIAITTQTVELVDCVRNTGRLDKEMYDNYKLALSKMDIICDIELEHKVRGIFENSQAWFLDTTIDIENALYEKGEYEFHIGDYFKMIVYSKNDGKREVIAYYGGTIRNERA